MSSIYKIFEVQKFFAANPSASLGKHIGTHFFDNADDERFQEAPGASWSSFARTKNIEGTLHDLYTIPNFTKPSDIIAFVDNMESEQANKKIQKNANQNQEYSEHKKNIERALILASKKTLEYLEAENYHITPMLRNFEFSSLSSFLSTYKILYKKAQTNISVRISLCTYLKELTTFFKIIRYPGFQVNYETGEIDLKNNDFIEEIENFFNDREIFEVKNGEAFSKDSPYMLGETILDGQQIPFQVSFGVKSVESLAEKIDGQAKYHLLDAVNDLHRMRVEVTDTKHAMSMGSKIFEKLGGNFQIRVIGNMISPEEANLYIDQFLQGNEQEELRTAFKEIKFETNGKATSAPRKELRLVRDGKNRANHALEVQIVLSDNTDEIGFAHHDIYRMKRKISTKIRLQSYIRHGEIISIINRIFKENEKKYGEITIPFPQERVLEYILEDMTKKRELVEIYSQKTKHSINRSYSNA